MSDYLKFTLHHPITEEEWDAITDVDFDHTEEIFFHTKHGKEVEFVKRKKGRWIKMSDADGIYWACSECGEDIPRTESIDKINFCSVCGADMRTSE